MLLWVLFRDKCPRGVIPLTALIIAALSRYLGDGWTIRIGDLNTSPGYVELVLGLLSWAIAAILVDAGYRTPRFFVAVLIKERRSPNRPFLGGH